MENSKNAKFDTNTRSHTKMNKMWNDKFSSEEYIYGTEPNEFLAEVLKDIKPGRILFVGEGEGRNAVYAAKLGWTVDAVDFAESGKLKAEKLAEENNVKINYIVSDLLDFDPGEENYDAIVNIFVHMPPAVREEVNKKLTKALRKNGRIILEVYEKEQIKYSTGGPKNEMMLYSLADIAEDFINLDFELFEKKIVHVNEGKGHSGEAAVIRFIGLKPAQS